MDKVALTAGLAGLIVVLIADEASAGAPELPHSDNPAVGVLTMAIAYDAICGDHTFDFVAIKEREQGRSWKKQEILDQAAAALPVLRENKDRFCPTAKMMFRESYGMAPE